MSISSQMCYYYNLSLHQYTCRPAGAFGVVEQMYYTPIAPLGPFVMLSKPIIKTCIINTHDETLIYIESGNMGNKIIICT